MKTTIEEKRRQLEMAMLVYAGLCDIAENISIGDPVVEKSKRDVRKVIKKWARELRDIE